ncbi:DctP family TRAP transporter solute-binding subunit [Ornithinimicrobium faecis]|uniref:DctP family TRAP transporter solute-binding subunit n=1 Tax=Ornithinimicrobium faecis TaxID=2934158 RepID=A0ABY4YWB6_9MICO|nr:DctP family TRAP transporter solute-binding subunit [Ornithinimicrobium sp. HY1793]USQ81069.1 DctP family TRAP transporter solute-binding subunit [Ornithinimicrobium sp. HY1793]
MKCSTHLRGIAGLSIVALALTACSGDSEAGETSGEAGGDGGGGETVTLSLAHSYATNHPHQTCGAELVKEQVEGADVGLEIEIFPDSTLGGHAERFASVVSGDIDIDIQGPSEISATFEPVGVLDAAYAFDDADHLFSFFESDAGVELGEQIIEGSGARILAPWYFGMRHFTSNTPLNTPEDFDGLRMRFPDTPQFLQNAEALGASPTSVAFEEVYISLQQGVVDGQENPIPTIDSLALPEVQSHLNLTGHMVGIHMIVMNEEKWQSLDGDQQETLQSVFQEVRDTNRGCIEDAENELVEQWEAEGTMEIVEPDVEAFRTKAEEFFTSELDGEKLELYQTIRDQA